MKQIKITIWKASLLITFSALFILAGCNGLTDNEPSAAFKINGDTADMAGVIDSTTPRVVQALIAKNPELKTINMVNVPGSSDDESNLKASRMIHAAGLSTSVPADGEIASGGVDFFLAGTSRTIEEGARIGVHSWADGEGTVAAELPRDHIDHQLYLEFYRNMGIDEEFYWFTLNAAPADSIHWMTRAEIKQFGMINSPEMRLPGAE